MNLQQQLEQVAFARRKELLPYVFDQTGGRVQSGPFKGMTIVPQTSWGDGDTAAKLLGVYEDELHEWILEEVKRKPDLVINVGCAEGYYIVGFGRLLPKSRFHAIDISEAAINSCRQNCMANGISEFSFSSSGTNAPWLNERCQVAQRPFLILDCESVELQLLDLTLAPNLKKASIMVECHDCMIPGITETLIDRFYHTHDIHKTEQQYKDPYQFDFLKDLSDCDKWALIQEGRPSTMTWLYMVPKQ